MAQALGSLGNAGGILVGPTDDAYEREAARASKSILSPGPSEISRPATGAPLPLAGGSSGGRSLDAASREFFESRLGMDLGAVRIHTGKAASEAAQALDANAFTVRSDIVFAKGKYAPGSSEGRRLLAHELAHVAQQTTAANSAGIREHPASPLVQRDVPYDKKKAGQGQTTMPGMFGPKWSYKHPGGRMPYYENYKSVVGQGKTEKIQAASQYGGTLIDPEQMEISEEDLRDILNPPGPNHDEKLDKTIESYRSSINVAFQIMQMDTVEAQAVYLAHAAGETGSLAQLEERYSVREKAYQKEGFPGRGPVQVTLQENYVKTLAYLETILEKLMVSNEPGAGNQAAVVKTALDAIKEDPSQAANPAFTFLFSGAFMHMSGGMRLSAQLGQKAGFPGDKAEDQWVNSQRNNKREYDEADASKKALDAKAAAGGASAPSKKQLDDAAGRVTEAKSVLDRSEIKSATYERAVKILGKKKKKGP